jgi:ArsR family transcriptional regulator
MVSSAATVPVDRVFRALADRTRLRILELLRTGEICVGDLVFALRIRQPAASRHLAYLRGAGLVAARARGPWVFYRLARPSRLHRRLLAVLPDCAATLRDAALDARRLRATRRSGGCCP